MRPDKNAYKIKAITNEEHDFWVGTVVRYLLSLILLLTLGTLPIVYLTFDNIDKQYRILCIHLCNMGFVLLSNPRMHIVEGRLLDRQSRIALMSSSISAVVILSTFLFTALDVHLIYYTCLYTIIIGIHIVPIMVEPIVPMLVGTLLTLAI